MAITFLLSILLFISGDAFAGKKWAGPVSGSWANALNWQPQGIPGSSDDVILDNSNQKNNFVVTLPDAAVEVHTLSLEPAAGNSIEVVIPPSNKSSPALIINDAANSFNINSGAVFRNSSGLTSGQSIQCNGSISIFNNGRYIHNTRSSHATEIVARLSMSAGTEKGIFEFDVPGGSYPISISNRSYGTLVLSSNASGGVQTYNASGSNQVILNGNFEINDGVQFNLDLTKDMIITSDYIQRGGVFNLASQPNNNSVKIKGNIMQSSSAIITETSSGLPVIELSGDDRQLVSFAGNITNSVALKINNLKGVALISSLTLPYKLELVTGAMKTSMINLLTLADNCSVSGGSVNSFIDGPIRKMGDDDFEFPVGKQGDYAPIKITGSGGLITDEFIAEYFLGDPGKAYGYNFESPTIVRTSHLEYWMLERRSGVSKKRVGVYVGNYSNATALKDLVLVRWDAGMSLWSSVGNSFYSGIATGGLLSNDVDSFGAFTLGSTVEMQNPLPVREGEVMMAPSQNMRSVKYKAVKNDLVTIVMSDAGGRRVLNFKLRWLRVSMISRFPRKLLPGGCISFLFMMERGNF